MKKITITKETFTEMLSGLIESGVTFEAKEIDGKIEIIFTGGIFGEVTWVAKNFKGIEPIYAKLELTKVLEKVNEFVFAN